MTRPVDLSALIQLINWVCRPLFGATSLNKSTLTISEASQNMGNGGVCLRNRRKYYFFFFLNHLYLSNCRYKNLG